MSWATGIQFPAGEEIFYLLQCPDWLCGPAGLLSNGYWREGSALGLK